MIMDIDRSIVGIDGGIEKFLCKLLTNQNKIILQNIGIHNIASMTNFRHQFSPIATKLLKLSVL